MLSEGNSPAPIASGPGAQVTLMGLAWPIFVESILMMLIGNVNVFMLSQYSANAVGAVGMATQITRMLAVLYSIVSTGASITISQFLGARQPKTAGAAARVAVLFNLALGVVLSVSILCGARWLLAMVNVPLELLEDARVYLLIAGGASIVQALLTSMSAICRSHGYARLPMYVMFGVNLLNIIGSYTSLYSPFGMPVFGVAGVAVTSVVSQLAGGVTLAIVVNRTLGVRMLPRKGDEPFPGLLRTILRVGMPAAGEYLSYSFSQIVITAFVGSLGSAAVTAKVYFQSIIGFVSLLGISVGQGTQIAVGHLIGSNDPDRAYRAGMRSLVVALASNVALSVLCFLFRNPLLSVFTRDPAILAIAGTVFLVDVVVECGRACNNVMGNALRGAGDVRFPMIVAVVSMWLVSVVLADVLGIRAGWGLAGIWVAFALDECARGAAMTYRWVSQKWLGKSVVGLPRGGQKPAT